MDEIGVHSSAPRRRMPDGLSASVDQVLWSSSNWVVLAGLGRSGGPAAVGEFALGYALYVFALGLVRSAAAEPLVADGGRSKAVATVSALGLGVGAGLAGAAMGSLMHSSVLIAVGVLLPLLLVHEVARYTAIAEGSWGRVLAMDGVWLGIAVAGVGLGRVSTPLSAVGIWVAGAVVSGAPRMLALARSVNSRSVGLLRAGISGRLSLAGGAALLGLALQGNIWVVGAVFGPMELGLVRAAQLFTTGLQFVANALYLTGIPRMVNAETDARRRTAVRNAGALAVVSALVSLVLWRWAGDVLALAFGERLGDASRFAVPMLAAGVAGVVGSSWEALARAEGRDRRVAMSRTVGAVASVVVLIAGALANDVGLAAWAWAAAYWAIVVSLVPCRRMPGRRRLASGSEQPLRG